MGSFTSTEAFEQAPEWFDREGLRRAEYKGTGFVGKWADITTWFLKLSKIPPMQVGLSQCLWPHPYCHSLKEIGKCKVASKHFHPSLGARILNPPLSLLLEMTEQQWDPWSQLVAKPATYHGQVLEVSGNNNPCQILAVTSTLSHTICYSEEKKKEKKKVFTAACQFCQPLQWVGSSPRSQVSARGLSITAALPARGQELGARNLPGTEPG